VIEKNSGKGKPVVRQGRKATGSAQQTAWLPLSDERQLFVLIGKFVNQACTLVVDPNY
jgi:hypothetical protein